MLPLLAAGNDGGNGFSTVSSPATAKNPISVGATMNSINAFTEVGCTSGYLPGGTCPASTNTFYSEANMAYFSSMGPTKDGRIKPDMVSPGYQIISAKSNGSPSTPSCPPTYASALKSKSGTSMATPITAGHAALVREYYRNGYWNGGVLNAAVGFLPSAALLKATLLVSSDLLVGVQDIGCCAYASGFQSATFVSPFPDPVAGKCCCATSMCTNRVSVAATNTNRNLPQTTPNTIQGYGRPALTRALPFAGATFSLLPLLRASWDATNFGDRSISTGTTLETAVCLSRTDQLTTYPFKVMLVWTDYPGSSSLVLMMMQLPI